MEKRKAPMVSVQEYLDYMGHSLHKAGSGSYRVDDHDSLVVTPSEDLWNWFSRGVGGSGKKIRLLMATLDGIVDEDEQNQKLSEIRQARGDGWKPNAYEKYEKKNFNIDEHKFSRQPTDSLNYLTKVRGIHPTIVKNLFKGGLLAEEVKTFPSKRGSGTFDATNLWYLWKDRKGTIVGADSQATMPSKSRSDDKHQGYWKGIVSGSPSAEHNFNFQIGEHRAPDKLYVFEAPVDAISFWQMNYDETKNETAAFVALSGVNKNSFLSYIRERYLGEDAMPFPKELHFAMDNDEPGRKFATEMHELTKVLGDFDDTKVFLDVPGDYNMKDWNDILRYGRYKVDSFEMNNMPDVPLYNPKWSIDGGFPNESVELSSDFATVAKPNLEISNQVPNMQPTIQQPAKDTMKM
jgi:hypothetical protein